MGKTIVERILSRAGGADAHAGDIVDASVSYVMTNDAVGELTIKAFEELGRGMWDPGRTVVILDHYIPASSPNAARVHALLRRFARNHGAHLFDQTGVCHQIMLEQFVRPGDLVIGTDSHTCTYGGVGAFGTGVGSTDGAAAMATGHLWLKVPETVRIELRGALRPNVSAKDVALHLVGTLGADGATYQALELGGPGADGITTEGRCTICNMAIEAGAKTGIFETGDIAPDPDAVYSRTITVELEVVEPMIAIPYAVDNVRPARDLAGTRIDQAFVGSCTNGRIEDLRAAAAQLAGKHVHPRVRLLVTPASSDVYLQATTEGLIETFIRAGAIVCNPGCSACFGGQGMLDAGEVCIGSHNRNFRGRMGHPDAKVYLASPETVALSAIAGEIVDLTQGGTP
ncbi:MAG: 3-isopropylmalate dehydratase large subunit [Spirochaetota bacterium]